MTVAQAHAEDVVVGIMAGISNDMSAEQQTAREGQVKYHGEGLIVLLFYNVLCIVAL
jgi:hypothetical protein